METYKAYHGTKLAYANRILSAGWFRISDKDMEWAGTGVYFFCDRNADKNAYKWAKFHKKYTDPCVLQATIQLEYETILDLRDEEEWSLFQAHRKAYFEAACQRAQKRGVNLEERLRSSGKLDCAVINQICETFSLQAVIKSVYIRSLDAENLVCFELYPSSFSPNCTIFCLRNQELITKLTKIEL